MESPGTLRLPLRPDKACLRLRLCHLSPDSPQPWRHPRERRMERGTGQQLRQVEAAGDARTETAAVALRPACPPEASLEPSTRKHVSALVEAVDSAELASSRHCQLPDRQPRAAPCGASQRGMSRHRASTAMASAVGLGRRAPPRLLPRPLPLHFPDMSLASFSAAPDLQRRRPPCQAPQPSRRPAQHRAAATSRHCEDPWRLRPPCHQAASTRARGTQET